MRANAILVAIIDDNLHMFATAQTLLGLQEIISGMSACPSQSGDTTTGIGKATEIGVISLVASDCISLGKAGSGTS